MAKINDCLVDARLPTKFGNFQLFAFPGDEETKEDLALVMGEIEGRMLVRVHSECFTGDVLHSMRCDCGEQLDFCLLYTSPSPRDQRGSRMPSSA